MQASRTWRSSRAGAAMSVRVVSGQEAPEWQGWKGIKNHQQGEYMPTPDRDLRVDRRGPARLVTLLYPARPGETCPVAAVHASTT